MDLSFLNKGKMHKLIQDNFKSPNFWAKCIGYILPISFLLYILYVNFLPFGYNKTFEIVPGSENDTQVSEFYLEPSPDLSGRQLDANGNTYRSLNGVATIIFKPKLNVKAASIDVSAEGKETLIIPPNIAINPSDIEWDQSWNFTKGVPKVFASSTAFLFDDSTYFNGSTRLELPNSHDLYEKDAFTVYA
ncbi:hypothetical protein KBA73_04490, partial [Patescibacteria group bacterium]|nr:hypothetical protein [Patescibacteria group bacterium]